MTPTPMVHFGFLVWMMWVWVMSILSQISMSEASLVLITVNGIQCHYNFRVNLASLLTMAQYVCSLTCFFSLYLIGHITRYATVC